MKLQGRDFDIETIQIQNWCSKFKAKSNKYKSLTNISAVPKIFPKPKIVFKILIEI